jgi:hypothetical protein
MDTRACAGALVATAAKIAQVLNAIFANFLMLHLALLLPLIPRFRRKAGSKGCHSHLRDERSNPRI